MQDEQEVQNRVLEFVTREFGEGREIKPGQRLVPDIVDSIGVFVLAEFAGNEFGVVLDDIDLSAENLASTTAFTAMVSAKLSPTL